MGHEGHTRIEDLERAVQLNEVLARKLGHELRNALGAITMAAQLIGMRDAEERAQRPVQRILANSELMARMIAQYVDLAKTQSGGGLGLRRAAVDLGELCKQLIEEASAIGPGRISLELLGDAKGSWDLERLTQVVTTLISNALEHGEVERGSQAILDGRNADTVLLSVENRGTIPPERLAGLFEPLCAGEVRASGKSHGLGLGLFLARQIAIAHGGSLDVASSDAGGTTFTLRLPRNPTGPA